jgi:hypothetical protein
MSMSDKVIVNMKKLLQILNNPKIRFKLRKIMVHLKK